MSPITYSGASCNSTASRRPRSNPGARLCASVSTRSECCATEKICAPLVCPFQRATRASPCAISSTSMSSAEGSSRSSRRPDSMRCQARGSDRRVSVVRPAESSVPPPLRKRHKKEPPLKGEGRVDEGDPGGVNRQNCPTRRPAAVNVPPFQGEEQDALRCGLLAPQPLAGDV